MTYPYMPLLSDESEALMAERLKALEYLMRLCLREGFEMQTTFSEADQRFGDTTIWELGGREWYFKKSDITSVAEYMRDEIEGDCNEQSA